MHYICHSDYSPVSSVATFSVYLFSIVFLLSLYLSFLLLLLLSLSLSVCVRVCLSLSLCVCACVFVVRLSTSLSLLSKSCRDQWLTAALQTAMGLEYVHSMNVVHRDIKPVHGQRTELRGAVFVACGNRMCCSFHTRQTSCSTAVALQKSAISGGYAVDIIHHVAQRPQTSYIARTLAMHG